MNQESDGMDPACSPFISYVFVLSVRMSAESVANYCYCPSSITVLVSGPEKLNDRLSDNRQGNLFFNALMDKPVDLSRVLNVIRNFFNVLEISQTLFHQLYQPALMTDPCDQTPKMSRIFRSKSVCCRSSTPSPMDCSIPNSIPLCTSFTKCPLPGLPVCK